jgi:hypothetical protein
MVDLGGLAGSFAGYAKSGMFWLVVLVFLVGLIFFFYVYTSRRSKLKYTCLELISFGNGKVGMNQTTAGIFKAKSMFFGLVDYGSEYVVKTADGKIIEKARTSQLHDIFGKKGFICVRKTEDPKILVPIGKVKFDNMLLMFDIAPSDYRDASTRIFKEAVEETKGTWEKLLPYIAIGLCVILTIVNVVVNMQMTNNTVNKVGTMLIEGCRNSQNVANAQAGAP